jgi:hypothetical protein
VDEVNGACGTHERGEKSVQGFGGKAQGKRPLGRPRHKWEDGIRMDLREIGWGGGMDSVGSGWGPWWAVVNAVMNLWVLHNIGS